MANEIKIEKIQSLIMKELNIMLQREFLQTGYIKLLSVNEVRITNDLSHAKIFYSIMLTNFDQNEVDLEIKENLKEIRYKLANKVQMRAVPEIEFKYDNSLDNANKIEQILKDIKRIKYKKMIL